MLRKMSEPIYASDLMSEARKNPEKYEGKRYKVIGGSSLCADTEEHYECEVRGGELMAKGDFVAVYSDTQLEEIKHELKPVPFMEAVKAYHNGKTIRCTHIFFGEREYKRQNDAGSLMKDDIHMPISSDEILYGQWYIIDEEGTP